MASIPNIEAAEVRRLLTMEECIGVVEQLYLHEADNIYHQPIRTVTRVDADSVILSMPAYSTRLQRFAVKVVTEFKNNPAKYSLPVQGGLILLMDCNNSSVLATLDAPMITAIRTGAVSGVATKLLARKDSKTVAVVGSGEQARTQLEAICEVRDISQANVYSRNRANSTRFATEMSQELGIPIRAYESRQAALENADVLILATNSATPVLDWSEVPKGCHINSIGTLPTHSELDVETIAHSRIFVDNKTAVPLEAGDMLNALNTGRITKKDIQGDLSDLLLDRIVGRSSEDQVTLFKSVGFALQDVYASSYVFDKSAQHPK